MRILIAPDKFKGSLTALAAAQAIERGFRSVYPDLTADLAPIADGGEGFAESLGAALHSEWITMKSVDPLGRGVEARYAWVAEQELAIIEMSEASGLWRLTPEERDALQANTLGTGLLLCDAVARGAKKILVGLGGSATTDGGIGVARALGYRFLSDAGQYQPLPSTLDLLAAIERPVGLRLPEIIAACDVQNPLLGDRGTARVYAAQKGADPHDIENLEFAMRHLADVCVTSLGRDFRDTPGAGAAGGLDLGCSHFVMRRSVRGSTLLPRRCGWMNGLPQLIWSSRAKAGLTTRRSMAKARRASRSGRVRRGKRSSGLRARWRKWRSGRGFSMRSSPSRTGRCHCPRRCNLRRSCWNARRLGRRN